MHNPYAMRPDEYTDAFGQCGERGECVVYHDDAGEVRVISAQHASGYHHDHAISPVRLRVEAERDRSSAWN